MIEGFVGEVVADCDREGRGRVGQLTGGAWWLVVGEEVRKRRRRFIYDSSIGMHTWHSGQKLKYRVNQPSPRLVSLLGALLFVLACSSAGGPGCNDPGSPVIFAAPSALARAVISNSNRTGCTPISSALSCLTTTRMPKRRANLGQRYYYPRSTTGPRRYV